jgi:hypothetical protein
MPLHAATRDAQEQETQARLQGTEAVKANILAAKTVARTLRSSLGPKGMDKMLQSPDGDVTISELLVAAAMAVAAGLRRRLGCRSVLWRRPLGSQLAVPPTHTS